MTNWWEGGKPDADAFDGTEQIPVAQGGAGKSGTVQQIADFVGDLPGGGSGSGAWMRGDGSDGAYTPADGDSLVPGYYTDFTIEDGVTVKVSSFSSGWPIIRCTGDFTINGTLDLRGIDADGFAPGDTSLGGLLGLGAGASGTTDAGTTPVETGTFLSARGTPVGGAGGDGLDGDAFAGGQKRNLGYPTSIGPKSGNLTTGNSVNVSLGGSSGGGDGTFYGGGGGGGGTWVLIIARRVIHGPNNLYLLDGGKGGDGGDSGSDGSPTGNGDCGGGGGGGAGYWITLSDEIDDVATNIGTVGNNGPTKFDGSGGVGGAGCGVGVDGENGDDGFSVHLLTN